MKGKHVHRFGGSVCAHIGGGGIIQPIIVSLSNREVICSHICLRKITLAVR